MRSLALILTAALLLSGCAASLASPEASRCLSAGPQASAAYQACMQAEYARAMQQMDYQAWLELTKGHDGRD